MQTDVKLNIINDGTIVKFSCLLYDILTRLILEGPGLRVFSPSSWLKYSVIIREARKRHRKLQYQGTPIQIFEDYTPEVASKRAKYRAVMADLYNLALRPALLFPARLQITLESGAKKRFSSLEEATTFAAKYQQTPRPE